MIAVVGSVLPTIDKPIRTSFLISPSLQAPFSPPISHSPPVWFKLTVTMTHSGLSALAFQGIADKELPSKASRGETLLTMTAVAFAFALRGHCRSLPQHLCTTLGFFDWINSWTGPGRGRTFSMLVMIGIALLLISRSSIVTDLTLPFWLSSMKLSQSSSITRSGAHLDFVFC